ncbi:24794_t:CDS:2, partial [Racocetra persica]
INCFIDGGRMPSANDLPNAKPMITNNLTEQMNKSVEERLYVILHSVKPAVEGSDTYFYIKKGNSEFRSPYTMRRISIDDKSSKLLQPMLNELASKHP